MFSPAGLRQFENQTVRIIWNAESSIIAQLGSTTGAGNITNSTTYVVRGYDDYGVLLGLTADNNASFFVPLHSILMMQLVGGTAAASKVA